MLKICLHSKTKPDEKLEYQANGRPKRKAKRLDINYSTMGFEEVTEELEKKSSDKEDEEVDEWMKMSDDLHHWDLPRAYVFNILQSITY